MQATQGVFSLEDLHLVATVGNAGSLAKAARRLGVDHSTAFRRLGALERRLGTRLFERARHGYSPTLAGEAAIAAAGRIVEYLGGLERQLAGQDLRPAGTVRVTTTDTLVDFLAPILAAFRRVHPQIIIELVVAGTFLTLTRREADVALRPSQAAAGPLVGRKVGQLGYAIYGAGPGLEKDLPRLVTAHDWIGFDDSLAHLAAAQWLNQHVPAERVVHRANSLHAMLAAARAGIGLVPLPCVLADNVRGLRRVVGPIGELGTPLWLLTHADLRAVARVRAFLDFAAGAIAERQGDLEGKAGTGGDGNA